MIESIHQLVIGNASDIFIIEQIPLLVTVEFSINVLSRLAAVADSFFIIFDIGIIVAFISTSTVHNYCFELIRAVICQRIFDIFTYIKNFWKFKLGVELSCSHAVLESLHLKSELVWKFSQLFDLFRIAYTIAL